MVRSLGERWSGRRGALCESALLACGFALLFAYLPHGLEGDDPKRFYDIERLLHHGRLTASPFSLVMPLFSAPFLLLGEVVRTPEWWAARFNVIVVAAGAGAAFLLLRDRVDPGLLRKLLLVMLFASFLTDRLRDYTTEVFTGTLVAIGLILVLVSRRTFAGWAAIVVGVVNTPAALGGAALLAAAEAIRTRRIRYALGPLVAAALIMTEAWVRRGGPFVTGQAYFRTAKTIVPYSGRQGFSFPFVLGLLSILFSFGRGLLFFMPGLVLGLLKSTRRLLRECRYVVFLMLLFVAGLVLVYAKWWSWYGGLSWGPRFFVFAALPASWFIAIRIQHSGESVVADAVTLLVLTLSAWISVSAATADHAFLYFCDQRDGHEALCWYAPEYSSLWHPILHFPALTRTKAFVAAFCAVVYVYLAAPLAFALTRSLFAFRLPKTWALGWRW